MYVFNIDILLLVKRKKSISHAQYILKASCNLNVWYRSVSALIYLTCFKNLTVTGWIYTDPLPEVSGTERAALLKAGLFHSNPIAERQVSKCWVKTVFYWRGTTSVMRTEGHSSCGTAKAKVVQMPASTFVFPSTLSESPLQQLCGDSPRVSK